jgi:hypothetical protein
LSAPQHAASIILAEYLSLLDRIFGMYVDACMGFEMFGEKIALHADPSQHDKRFFMGDGDPNPADAKYHHVTTIGSFISRNRRDGENQLLLSQSCIVFIYSIWDTMVRPKYCKGLGRHQGDVTCDIMGDLRQYRNAILHNNAKLQKPTRRLSFVDVGNIVVLNQSQVRELFALLFDDLCALNSRHTGERIDLPFYRSLNKSSPS